MIHGIQVKSNHKTTTSIPHYDLKYFAELFDLYFYNFKQHDKIYSQLKTPCIVEYQINYNIPSYFAKGLSCKIPKQILFNPYDIWRILESASSLYPNNIAFESFTYSNMYYMTINLIKWLQSQINSTKQQTLFIFLPNSPHTLLIHYVCAGLRWIVVNGNTQLT